jgi:hypothetical protein
MGCIILRVYPDGRVERSERARSWREREELLGYALFLQPALGALDIAAGTWRDLTAPPGDEAGDRLRHGAMRRAMRRRAADR